MLPILRNGPVLVVCRSARDPVDDQLDLAFGEHPARWHRPRTWVGQQLDDQAFVGIARDHDRSGVPGGHHRPVGIRVPPAE
jgi:hypothetical protein